MNICQSCGQEFEPQRNTKGLYCSRSCSAKVNGSKYPKRTLTNVCGYNQCTTLIYRNQRRCAEHKGLRVYKNGVDVRTHGLYTEQAHDLTLAEARKKLGYPTTDEFAKFLRSHARRWAMVNLPHVSCHSCDYDKTTELAHIKPLKHFKDSDLIRHTIENNLVRLCPNHHWEFDHGLHSVYFKI